jgi:hypothetical protein
MGKQEKNIVKTAQEYFYSFIESHKDVFVFHDYRFVNESVSSCKEIGKAEDLDKEDYELGITALILSEMGLQETANKEIENTTVLSRFIELNNLSEQEVKEINYYTDFFRKNKLPQNHVEEVLRDGKDLFLAMPDALERLSLLRIELERAESKIYNELEWLQFCKSYFITHTFYTRYANHTYGSQRSKNYFELERRIDKLKSDSNKEKKSHDKPITDEIGLNKESEDLFKIAFRNYLNLVGIADKKAGLLIQVNSILASVIIGFASEKIDENLLYIIPIGSILIVAGVTIFYGILASKPLDKAFLKDVTYEKQPFFFGSFDKMDPDFQHASLSGYYNDMNELFKGDKQLLFDELIKESFQVRKVLSKKFTFLDIAYKVFFAGLVFVILTFIVVMIIQSQQ